MPHPTLPLALYGAVSRTTGLLVAARAITRLRVAGVSPERAAERNGRATLTRPTGPLVWFHGASVGESLSVLPLIERVGIRALVTSGTETSARILAGRLPPQAMHQFAPVDHPGAVKRFLDHWHPDLAVFAESEIWPGLLTRTAARGVPLALVNARLSARSRRRWERIPRTTAALFGLFDLVAVQDDATRACLAPFLRPGVLRHAGNLKAAAPPPPCPPADLEAWRRLVGDRPLWVASSTHPGEEEVALEAHSDLLRRSPDALLILAPRHPERGAAIRALASRQFTTVRLSDGEVPDAGSQVVVADTIGQTGLWYRLARVVFLAGSLGQAGGHNPWEAVSLGAALLHGPNVANAAGDYAQLDAGGAAQCVYTAEELAAAVRRLLADPQALAARSGAAEAAGLAARALADAVAADLRALLGTRP